MNNIKIVRAEEEKEGIKLVRAGDEPVKKKDETIVSPGKEDETSTPLDTEPEKEKPRSVSSDSEKQIFTDYPGKETNQYKIVDGNWQWREKAPVKMPNLIDVFSGTTQSAEEYTPWKTVKNKGRISGLDSRYLKDPEKLKETPEKIAYDPEEDMQRKKDIAASKLMKQTPYPVFGTDRPRGGFALQDFTAVKESTQENIKGLTTQMQLELEAVKGSPEEMQKVRDRFAPLLEAEQATLINTNTAEQINKSEFVREVKNYKTSELEQKFKKEITPLFIMKSEGEAVEFLEEKYSDLGFTFFEKGIGDAVEVMSFNGKTIDINLQYLPDAEEASKLRGFLIANQVPENEQKQLNELSPDEYKDYLASEFTKNPEKFDEEVYDWIKKHIDKNLKELSSGIKGVNRKDEDLSKRVDDFNLRLDKAGGEMNSEMVAEYEVLKEESAALDREKEGLQTKYFAVQDQSSDIDRSAAILYINKQKLEEKEGTTMGAIKNKLLKGFQSPSIAATSIASNLAPVFLGEEAMNPLLYEQLKSEGLSETQILDRAKKGLLKDLMPGVEKGFTDLLGSSTTDAYINSEDRDMFTQAVFGLAETIPTLIAGGGNKALTFANLAAMSYGHIESEMMDNPEFADVSENEKKLISVPYAIVMGALEEFGFSKLMSKNPMAGSFTNKIIKKVFSTLPKDASVDVIEGALKREVKSNILSGVYKIAGGALIEGETGALQELADIGIKDVYNTIKGKDAFETPEGFAARLKQVGDAAAMEAMGGGILKTMVQSSTVMTKGFAKGKVSNEDASVLHDIGNDAEFRSILAADLKTKIATKDITVEEANKTLTDYDSMMGRMSKIPADTKDIARAFDLVTEKEKLEKEIAGKDQALSQNKKDRITAINEELINIDKDAVQERKTETVPVEPKAKVSEEVVEGAPVPKSEAVAEEGEVKEEVAEKETFESAVTKGTDQAVKWLDDIDKKLSDFGKETLGMNVPTVVAQAAVKAAKVAAKTLNNVSEIIDVAIQHVKDSDWYKGLNESDKADAESQIRDVFDKGVVTPKEAAVAKALEKFDISTKRGNTKEQAMESTVADLQKSDWYAQADDIARESAIRDLRKTLGVKEKAAPSVAKVKGEKSPKKVTVNERTALRNQIVLEARAAKEGAKSEKDVRKNIAATVKNVLEGAKAKFTATQTKAITSRALKMNLSNPVMAERFIDYVSKVAADVEYSSKLDTAFSERKKVKKKGKAKGQQAEVKAQANSFSKINPRTVEDIDEYLEMSQKMKRAVTPTTTMRGELVMRDSSTIAEIREYTAKALENQEHINSEEMQLQFSELFDVGLLNDKMTVQEMREVVRGLAQSDSPSIKNEDAVRAQIENVYESYAGILEQMIETKTDPFTGEEVEIKPSNARAIRQALKLDVTDLDLKELFTLVDMLGNFTSNGFSGGLNSFVSYASGKFAAQEYFKKYGKARKMNPALRAFNYHFTSLPVLIETVLTGATKAGAFMSESGFSSLVRGANYAQRLAQKILGEYANTFHKKKPNGESFNTAKNTYERGMYGFLIRNVIGSETEMKTDFDRRVRLINESIAELTGNRASKTEMKKGAIYAEIAEKIGLNDAGATMESIGKKIDPINKDAALWWVDKWSEYYDELSDVSLNVYNIELATDLNYTPDRYKKKDIAEPDAIEDIMNGAFGEYKDSAYNKESGSLMAANKPKILPKGRVIDLDFDINNFSMIEAALIDMHTAEDIRKIEGFKRSDAFNDIFSIEDGKVVNSRINDYILRVRRKDITRDEQTKMFKQAMNILAKAGTTMALGGIDQLPKQSISVMVNTLANSGGRMDLMAAMSKDAREWIDVSGMPIAQRGLEAEANIDVAEKNLNKHVGNTKRVMRAIGNMNEAYLKLFLSSPDKVVARAAFISYYKQKMKRMGLPTDIDYSAPMNVDAANYAQHMVDRQQNISDSNLAGNLFTSRHWSADTIKKTLFPFANFIMNQKSRMYSDLRTLSLKEGTTEDKIIAGKSLVGLGLELAAFHAISIAIRSLYKEIAREITGYEPEKEDKDVIKAVERENDLRETRDEPAMTEKEERKFRYDFVQKREAKKNKKTFWTAVIKDIFSPLPAADDIVAKQANNLLEATSMTKSADSKEANQAVRDENAVRLLKKGGEKMTPEQEKDFREKFAKEDIFQLWDFNDKGRSFGVIGIALEKREDLEKMAEAGSEGTVTTEVFGQKTKKYLLPEDQEIAKYNAWAMRLYVLGILPADVGKEANYIQKNLERSALTKKQMETYTELEKEGPVDEKEFKLIKEGKSMKQLNIRRKRIEMGRSE